MLNNILLNPSHARLAAPVLRADRRRKIAVHFSGADGKAPEMPSRVTAFVQRGIAGLALAALFSGCGLFPTASERRTHSHAFIVYWPSAIHSTRLRLAVKDNIDMKGVVTSAGSEYFARNHRPAQKDAACLAIARSRGVDIVGKTNLTEFAVSPSGVNAFFGTPPNPFHHTLLPGGSSSGSAVALACNYADVSLGTDTAGSIRTPAACCGVVGLKTTFGLVSLQGVYPIDARHLDTVGPLARDIEHTVIGMNLLEAGFDSKYAAAKAAKPTARAIRIGRLRIAGVDKEVDEAIDHALRIAGFEVVELDDQFRAAWDQAKKDGDTVAAASAWMANSRYLSKPGVSARTKSVLLVGRIASGAPYRKALSRQKAWQETLRHTFQHVDLIALPTLRTKPPSLFPNLGLGILEAVMLNQQNTVAANFSGNPALAMPVPLHHEHFRVASLELVGPRLHEAELLNAGRFVEEAVKKEHSHAFISF